MSVHRPGLALPSGCVLDRQFVVEDLLGSPGGTGMAYLGWDRTLQRKVVIKELFPDGLVTRSPNGLEVQVLRPALQQAFALHRALFLDEARTLARLDGVESVVRVIHFFAENDTAYFVMPWVPGKPLSDFIGPNHQVDATTLLGWVWPLMDGLAAVHQAGLLHRDVKPQNLLIDDRGRPVLIDFGNAALLNGLAQRSSSFFAVSPHFGAPEQYANDNSRMGPWTDIYGLGALMYHALTGQRPTDARQRLAGQDLPAIDDLAPQVPQPLREAVTRCLALEEQQRPQSVQALQQWLAPLRPASRHWVQALPDNAFGRRQRVIHAQVQAGRALPRGMNIVAGACQWFWLLAHRLTAAGAISGGLMLALVGSALMLGGAGPVLPLALALAWVIGFLPCALFADALHYRRVSAVGSSLPLGNDAQWQHARQALADEGRPHPGLLMSGLLVPAGLVLLVLVAAGQEAAVRQRVERAMALEALREQIDQYQAAHGVPPSAEDLGFVDQPSSETRAIEVKAGVVDVVLAVPGAEGRRVRWRREGPSWTCESVDLAPRHLPSACALSNSPDRGQD